MSLAIVSALVWLIAANLIAMLPSRDQHWTNAYVLIAIGIPLAGWVTFLHGPIPGMVFLAAGASVLRWPLIYLWRWVRAKSGPQEPAE
jgi:hypothetical protein